MKSSTQSLLGRSAVLPSASFWKDSLLGSTVEYIEVMANTFANSVPRTQGITPPPSHFVSHAPVPLSFLTDMLSAKVTCVLDCFPPRSQTHLSPGLHTLVRLQNGSSTNPSKAQTIRTHRLHFTWWTRHYRIYDSLFPHIHYTVTTEALNLLMALYASHLLSGHSLLCKTVRTDTALKYLQAASSFLTHFDHDTSSSDARHRPSSSHTLCPQNSGRSIKAAKRFES
eukprot:jgi/Psemu1/24800/gm1.24800_g